MPTLTPMAPLERVAGHPIVEAALTYIGAAAGTPLAALLPVLSKALASERQRQRVESTLAEIAQVLARHEGAIRVLTDAQYKLLNEVILALLHTTEVEKFQYLRRAVSNTLFANELVPQDAAVLSRTVRDISAAEADFVVQNFSFDRVWLTTEQNETSGRALLVTPTSPQAVIVSGLTSLGLLLSGSSDFASLGMLEWSPVTAKLITILRDPDA